ncbi:hypothetical protein KIPB_014458, partial [Kipferlia bialata]
SESDLANSTLNLGTIQADKINIGRGTTNVNVLGKATFDNAIIADDSLGVTDSITMASSGVVLETKLDVLGVTSTFGSDTQSFLTVDPTGTVTVENADVVWTSNYPFDAHNIDPLEVTTAAITGTTVLDIDSPSGTFVNIATDTGGGGLVLGRDNLSVITANSLLHTTKGLKTDEICTVSDSLTVEASTVELDGVLLELGSATDSTYTINHVGPAASTLIISGSDEDTTGVGGHVLIQGGDSPDSTGGMVTIDGGAAVGGQVAGSVYVGGASEAVDISVSTKTTTIQGLLTVDETSLFQDHVVMDTQVTVPTIFGTLTKGLEVDVTLGEAITLGASAGSISLGQAALLAATPTVHVHGHSME